MLGSEAMRLLACGAVGLWGCGAVGPAYLRDGGAVGLRVW